MTSRRRALRRALASGLASLLAIAAVLGATSEPATGEGDTDKGAWSAPFSIPVIGIHSAVLPSGKVLLFSKPRNSAGSEAWLWDPGTGTTSNVSQTYERDIFCSGHSFLPDGRLFVSGGHVKGTPNADKAGVKENDLFDYRDSSWTPAPPLGVASWYPTTIELGDGKVLIFGGDENKLTKRSKVESYDPASNTIATLPPTADKKVGSYPSMHLLPNGKVFKSGTTKGSDSFNPATNTWSWVGNKKYGSRQNGSYVLLPGLQKVLAFGGKDGTLGVTATAEIIDFSAPKPVWNYTGSLTNARNHANGVLLADGTVLAVGGSAGGSFEVARAAKQTELFDPATGTWKAMATQEAPRMYHSTAVLLPDGRVLSAGTDNGTAYQYTAEIYSPPYLFKGPRPVIGAAPSSVGYGRQFTIDTPDAGAISRVALVRPGSVTHSTAFDQRYVDLTFTASAGSLTAAAPPTANHAPPGWYMLLVVDSSGVPSVASWVHVSDPPPPSP